MTTETLPKACVILGAGASFDVHNSGSVLIQAAWKPPLASDLFNIEAHPNYRDILRSYPGADFLAQQLAPVNGTPGFNIETELRRLAEHPDEQTRRLFKHIPPYLRDLIRRCSREYTARPSCYDQLVFRLLAEDPHEVLFLVLNYDDLLESALSGYNPSFTYGNWHDYIDPGRKAKLVKLHGSINWYITIGDHSRAWRSLIDDLDISKKPPDDSVIVAPDLVSVESAVDSGSRLYPLLTAPLAGKGQADLVCPNGHIAVAQQFLKTCSKFLIIGTSGLDDDLLDLLDTSVPHNSRPFVHFVGISDLENVADRFCKGVKAFGHVSKTHSQPEKFKQGFREYVSGEGIRNFAEGKLF